MPIKFDELQIGHQYDRPFLAKLWGYRGIQGLSKGVVTPNRSKIIILFVTRIKQNSLQQYNDYIDNNLLFWEGEDKHSSDQRIIESKKLGDEIHLFFRDIHHTSFVYFGIIHLIEFQKNNTKPSEFIFIIEGLQRTPDIIDDLALSEQEFQNLSITERQALEKSRIGQGVFRENLIKLWGSCSITGLANLSLVRASHIKPWRDSTNVERLNPFNGLLLVPNYDLLFDRGLIAFKENGQIIISSKLSHEEKRVFDLDSTQRLRQIFLGNKLFLEYHRDYVLKK